MSKFIKILTTVLLIAVIVLSMLQCHACYKKTQTPFVESTVTKRDTVTRTLVDIQTKYIPRYINLYNTDTVTVFKQQPVNDSITLYTHVDYDTNYVLYDSIFAHKFYKHNYCIDITYKEKYITKTITHDSIITINTVKTIIPKYTTLYGVVQNDFNPYSIQVGADLHFYNGYGIGFTKAINNSSFTFRITKRLFQW